MSMLTPTGLSGRGRRRRRRWLLPVALLLVVAAGGAAWAGGVFGSSSSDSTPPPAAAPQTAPRVTCNQGPAPRTVTVRVLNATHRDKVAATTGRQLAARGFRIAQVGNTARKNDRAPTVIRFAPRSAAGARVLAAQLARARLVQEPRRADPRVDLEIGGDFAGLRPPQRPQPGCPP